MKFYLIAIYISRTNQRSISYENTKFEEDQPENGNLFSDSEVTHPYTTRRIGSKIPRPFDKPQRSNNFKSLNRNRKPNGMYSDAHARNNSAPGTRTRKERQSISDFSSLSIQGRGMRNTANKSYFIDLYHHINTNYLKNLHTYAYIINILGSPKKAKPKTKERKRKNTDPFQNFGMPLERF